MPIPADASDEYLTMEFSTKSRYDRLGTVLGLEDVVVRRMPARKPSVEASPRPRAPRQNHEPLDGQGLATFALVRTGQKPRFDITLRAVCMAIFPAPAGVACCAGGTTARETRESAR